MFELPLSVVAWISVVLVQAIVHFVVLGSRRGQPVAGPTQDDAALEECLSLATADTAEDADTSFTVQESGYQGTVIPSDPSTPVLMGEKEIICPDPEQFFELLDQTGTELLKVSCIGRIFPYFSALPAEYSLGSPPLRQSRSVQCIVEEQMRSIAQ